MIPWHMYIVNTQPRGIHAQFKRSPCTVSAETMHKTNGLCALTERNMHKTKSQDFYMEKLGQNRRYLTTLSFNQKRIFDQTTNRMKGNMI